MTESNRHRPVPAPRPPHDPVVPTLVLRAAGVGLVAGAAAGFVAAWVRPRSFGTGSYAAPRPVRPHPVQVDGAGGR